MIEYLILAISFAIMLHFWYIWEVLGVIKGVRIVLNIEHEPNPFSPFFFSIVFFIFSSIMMPAMAIYILVTERKVVIKDLSSAILKSYYELEEKK